ncbi:MAG: hypothetical protein ACK5Z5_01460 [Neisseriaceae bacterium]
MNSIKEELITYLNSYIGSKTKLGIAANSLNFTFDSNDFLYMNPLWRYEYEDKVIMTSYDFMSYPDDNLEDDQLKEAKVKYENDFTTRCRQLRNVFDGIKLENYVLSKNFDLTLTFSNDHIVKQFHDNTIPQEQGNDVSYLDSGWVLFTSQVDFLGFADKIEKHKHNKDKEAF